jgi:hypothetical protein
MNLNEAEAGGVMLSKRLSGSNFGISWRKSALEVARRMVPTAGWRNDRCCCRRGRKGERAARAAAGGGWGEKDGTRGNIRPSLELGKDSVPPFAPFSHAVIKFDGCCLYYSIV